MKKKYYPHLTAAGMCLMFVVPLLMVVAARQVQLADDDEVEDLLASVDPVLKSHDEENGAPVELATDFGSQAVINPIEKNSTSDELPPPNFFETRVALAPTSIAPLTDADGRSVKSSTVNNAPEDLLATLDEPRAIGAIEAVPSPINVVVSDVPPVNNVNATMRDASADDSEAVSQSPSTSSDKPVPSYFEATSHLAIRNALGSQSVAGPPVTVMNGIGSSPAQTTSDLDKEMQSAMTGRMTQAAPNAGKIPSVDDPFANTAQHTIVDVVLQQPLEIRRVKRVENVVAQTSAPGWPIALVKSDLPDDHWWVQQMVGIRGNAFAARVNFGNENSIPGSVYHMVFVFLDSPDEVRRFRIAKRFKELPAGTRRSRKFTFTRR